MRALVGVVVGLALLGVVAVPSADAGLIVLKPASQTTAADHLQQLISMSGEAASFEASAGSFAFRFDDPPMDLQFNEILTYWLENRLPALNSYTLLDLSQAIVRARIRCAIPSGPSWCNRLDQFLSYVDVLRDRLAGEPPSVAAPEPGTLLMMGTGVLTVLGVRRRNARRNAVARNRGNFT
jgi:hypothetical protein